MSSCCADELIVWYVVKDWTEAKVILGGGKFRELGLGFVEGSSSIYERNGEKQVGWVGTGGWVAHCGLSERPDRTKTNDALAFA